ncbi:hypothetical protein LVJ94_21025 [Pendulispora rubella]|uniref:Uncharacterized protein n=1 Tax=Pendulispora rubella TaxID=2741070 RepID=A0ABZ2LFI4_9BACT
MTCTRSSFARRAAIVALALAPCFGFLSTVATDDAEASVSISVAFDSLVQDSVSAGVMTPVEQYAALEKGRIYTYTRVKVDNAIAGDLGTGAEAWVVTVGGVIGNVGQTVDGEAVLHVGEPTLLFIRPDPNFPGLYMVTSRGQGQYAVASDSAKKTKVLLLGNGHGAVLPPPPTAASSKAPRVLARDAIVGHQLDETIRTVAAAWGRLHAK